MSLIVASFVIGGLNAAQAGVFTLPHFVPAGDWALGLEPELTLTSGAGLGANVKFTHGLTELNRDKRVGGEVLFEIW